MIERPAALPERVYQQLSPRVTGWFFVVMALILLALAIRSWGSNPAPVLVVWLVLGIVLCWTVLLRPAVTLSLAGVTFRNVLRDVHLPWNQVDVIEPRWNLKVYTPQDKGYNAWAISSQAHRPGAGMQTTDGGMNPMARLASFNPLGAGGLGSSVADERTATSRSGKGAARVTAASVASDIMAAKAEYDEAAGAGTIEEQTGPVRTSWSWPSIAALTVAIIAVIIVMVR